MASFDVAARLAEGGPVVDEITEYVAACRQLGYQHPDLAAPADLYGAQDGLDLRALDADVAALRAASAVTEDVAGGQADAVAALRAEWVGAGADAATGFLTRHQRAGDAVDAAIREAADTLAVLRDDLWRAIDAKVVATLEVAAGTDGARGRWLAAARTLTTGAGDRATASEIVDLEVKPFVDNAVGVQWVAAMRTASDAVVSAYEAATARLSGAGRAVFEVPFDLGPRPVEAQERSVAPVPPSAMAPTAVAPAPVVPAPVVPAAFDPPPSAAPAAPPAAAPPPPLADPGLGVPPASPALPSLPSLGETGGGLGSGASGFGSQLADLLGGLGGLSDAGEFGSTAVEPDDIDDDIDDEPDDELEDLDEEPEEELEETADDEPVEGEVPEEPDEPAESVVPEEPVAPEPTPPPPPVAEPLAAPPPPLPEEVTPPIEQTPCEIAADELPQVGE